MAASWLIDGDGGCQFAVGRLLGLIGTVMDVTQREAERLALRESESRFRSLVALTTD